MKPIVQYGAYPTIVVGSVWGNTYLLDAGAGLLLSTYLPVIIGTLLIIWLELRMPYQVSWKPSGKEVAEDSTFLALVHVLWPKLLAMGVAYLLFDIWNAKDWPAHQWWPREWPIPMQALMMALIVDSTRYWLHRISHEWEPLWRFHAVHHSPHRLYTLNAGRFHPVDKGLQFVLDSLPFIMMGISPAVLSLYFVFYAVNGFFQHSNVDVKLGWLNYFNKRSRVASLAPFDVVAGIQHQLRESSHRLGLALWHALSTCESRGQNTRAGQSSLSNRLYEPDSCAVLFWIG